MISAAEAAPGEVEEAFLIGNNQEKCLIPASPGAGSGASSWMLPMHLSRVQP